MKNLLFLLSMFFLYSTIITAQSSPIQIEEKQVPGGIEFYCHSNASTDFEITFGLEKTRNIKGYSKPIKKLVPAKESILLLKIQTSQGHAYTYTTQLRQKQAGSRSAANSFGQSKMADDHNKGIVLFDKTGCGRCTMAGNYLFDHGVKFTVLNISKDENNALMWEKLREQGFRGKRFQTPAIMVDGEISHSHKNLEKFLRKLVN